MPMLLNARACASASPSARASSSARWKCSSASSTAPRCQAIAPRRWAARCSARASRLRCASSSARTAHPSAASCSPSRPWDSAASRASGVRASATPGASNRRRSTTSRYRPWRASADSSESSADSSEKNEAIVTASLLPRHRKLGERQDGRLDLVELNVLQSAELRPQRVGRLPPPDGELALRLHIPGILHAVLVEIVIGVVVLDLEQRGIGRIELQTRGREREVELRRIAHRHGDEDRVSRLEGRPVGALQQTGGVDLELKERLAGITGQAPVEQLHPAVFPDLGIEARRIG